MAGLWWITVTMVFCLAAGSLAEIDLKQLAGLTEQIRTDIRGGYRINTMYAMAVSIPKDANQVSYDLKKVTTKLQTTDQWNDGILRSRRLVVATVDKPQHAEWRVLQNLNLEGQNGDLLVFFSYATPCLTSCANPNGPYKITDELKSLFDKPVWGEKAFVFEVIFKPHGMTDSAVERKQLERDTKLALENIGNSIGSKNIFRCSNLRCIRCFTGDEISQNCIS